MTMSTDRPALWKVIIGATLMVGTLDISDAFIAFSATTVFLLASHKLPLASHPFLYGALFGVALYVVMNYIVLPLSKIGLRPTPPLIPLINGVAALIFCIGIPLALIARRYIPQQIP